MYISVEFYAQQLVFHQEAYGTFQAAPYNLVLLCVTYKHHVQSWAIFYSSSLGLIIFCVDGVAGVLNVFNVPVPHFRTFCCIPFKSNWGILSNGFIKNQSREFFKY